MSDYGSLQPNIGAYFQIGTGIYSVVVEDEDMAGRQAFIVLIDENGSLAAQSATVIGGGAV